ncbi:hypothetical protein [Nocardia sp. NBC_01388]|uniref:hypothetical protein n=1 Tax=Nocardia sp. NBC_01388 TaxID=2903596 RepID=UPI003251440E
MSEAVNLELAVRMPWLVAEPESIWVITGTYRSGKDRFTDCLAMVLPLEITDGHRLFQLIHPAIVDTDPANPDRLIAPNRITHGRRLVLVHAEEPRTAYWADEQDLIDRGEDHA